jgi:hypothetical protein
MIFARSKAERAGRFSVLRAKRLASLAAAGMERANQILALIFNGIREGFDCLVASIGRAALWLAMSAGTRRFAKMQSTRAGEIETIGSISGIFHKKILTLYSI